MSKVSRVFSNEREMYHCLTSLSPHDIFVAQACHIIAAKYSTCHSLLIYPAFCWYNFGSKDPKSRCVLDIEKAREIYSFKHLANTSSPTPNLQGKDVSSSVLLAAHYGVSPKTIRDIWSRKTWNRANAELSSDRTALTTTCLIDFGSPDFQVKARYLFVFLFRP